jgi:hypothetical protein
LRLLSAGIILALFGAIFLGWKTSSAKKTAIVEKEDAVKAKDEATSKLSGAEAKAKKATEEMQTAQTALETSKKEAEANKKKADDNLAELKKTEAELSKKAAEAQAAQSKLDQLNKVLPPGMPPEKILDEMKRVTQDLETLNDEKKILSTKLAELENENKQLQNRVNRRVAGEIPKDLVGHVMAVNSEWNFVVLDVGEDDGIVANRFMTIYREGQLLGKVKITSVEPSISIGDIIPKWTHGEIHEGDSAIAAETPNGGS